MPVSIDNYLKLENKGKVNKAVTIFPRFNITEFIGIQNIITEDSLSGIEFFKEYFPEINSESAHSKSEMASYLKNNFASLNGILAVYDASAFAFSAKEFFKVVGDSNLKILDWESYENFLLRNEPFYEEYNQSDMSCDYESLEQFSEERLKQLVGYNKGSLLKCIKKDCICGKCDKVTDCKFKHGKLNYKLTISKGLY